MNLSDKRDWLHDWFYGGPAPARVELPLEKIRAVAVQLVYPEWAMSNLERQRRREERRGGAGAAFDRETEREANHNRRIYIRIGKKNQMWQWFEALTAHKAEIRQNLTPWERDFLNDLRLKFRRARRWRFSQPDDFNFLQRVKLTRRQYGALHYIAHTVLGAEIVRGRADKA